jgi:putative transcriptional regulator
MEKANNVATARRLAGLKQGELAKRVGVSRPLISMIETGIVRPSAELSMKLSAALQIPEVELFSNDGEA